jgi:hypothetical protein
LHLFVEPSAQAAWRRAHRPLTRVELDWRKTEEREKVNAFKTEEEGEKVNAFQN